MDAKQSRAETGIERVSVQLDFLGRVILSFFHCKEKKKQVVRNWRFKSWESE